MNITKELDLAIKLSEAKTTEGGYVINGATKNTYMTNAEWDAFKSAMLPTALDEYDAGGGDELSEKNGRPPKMASYGSSSRMIYNLSCNKEGFHFEKKLPTTIGGTAHLDGFYEDNDRYIFIEAKCHEPYSSKKVSVSFCYEKLYSFINELMADSLNIEMQTSKCGRYLNVEYFAEGEKLEHFDMKQMICHLLGVATGILKGKLIQKQIDFIYLLFDPTELHMDAAAKEIIDAIYERTCYECNLVDLTALFRAILLFLRDEKYNDAITDAELDDVVCRFTFALASQELYPLLIQ